MTVVRCALVKMETKLEKTAIAGRDHETRQVLTVSQLNRRVRFLLESQYPGLWVEGEISNFKKHSSGHIYFTLKDENAQISAAFFSQYQRALRFELKDGLKVLVLCRVSVYEARGQYQLYVEQVEPKGVGALQIAFQQLKEKLGREGLFAEERKRSIPRFPGTVGIVTSPTGAAIHDILNVVNRRFCGTRLWLYPVRVQGEGAAEEIAAAIDALNGLEEPEVLIVGRGGGSLEDLWAFNEEAVARAVFRSRVPVISAVGHETDWTICDLVADLRAPTPSAAAELVVASRQELEQSMRDHGVRLRDALWSLWEEGKERLTDLTTRAGFRQPRYLLDQRFETTDELARRLQTVFRTVIALKRRGFENLTGRLNALNPLGILERGYAVAFNREGEILKDLRGVVLGDEIVTRLHRGSLVSKVTEIIQREKGEFHGGKSRKT